MGNGAISRLRFLGKALWRELFAPCDVASLAFFRVAFGISLFALATFLYNATYIEAVGRDGFHCTAPGLDWVRPLPHGGTLFEVYALRILAITIAFGFLYRISCALFGLIHTHILLMDMSFYQNHLYLVCLFCFLLTFMPGHRRYSVDALLWPSLRSGTIPAWPVWAIRLQFALVFFFGGVAKCSYDWLHGEPIRAFLERSDIAVRMHQQEWMVYGFSYVGLVFDLAIPFLFMSRRTRLLAFDISLVFNILNAQIWDIDIFPYFLMAGTTIYFDSDWPKQIWHRLRRSGKKVVAVQQDFADSPLSATRKFLVAAGLGVYFLIQLYLPLRHYLIPGNVLWTDEGRYFAWRMFMVRKRTLATFHARDPKTGESWVVNPTAFGLPTYSALNPWSMPHNAHMFARYAAEEYDRQGKQGVEVRAEVLCSLHRRKPQLLFDPGLNLATLPYSFWHSPWISELREPLPLTRVERVQALEAWIDLGGDAREW
ncbi:MAG: HTTM domain-containing protein [Candidatus Hydrogenedentes bacterium]|nr:HTTM domain-containing protein [Candidatus Hydrogenedentota bacterium]